MLNLIDSDSAKVTMSSSDLHHASTKLSHFCGSVSSHIYKLNWFISSINLHLSHSFSACVLHFHLQRKRGSHTKSKYLSLHLQIDLFWGCCYYCCCFCLFVVFFCMRNLGFLCIYYLITHVEIMLDAYWTCGIDWSSNLNCQLYESTGNTEIGFMAVLNQYQPVIDHL